MKKDWWIFQGTGVPHEGIDRLPPPPPWRGFKGQPIDRQKVPPEERPITFQSSPEEIELVNTALYLRRPLLITGKPGTGKSSLAYAVAQELQLGRVLVWPINTRSTLTEGLYRYDAIGRLQAASLQRNTQSETAQAPDISEYLQLGPLGTALLPSKRPRVLLIDEIDKSDIDLPNDLLHVFEEGRFEIPELSRLARRGDRSKAAVRPCDGEELIPIGGGEIVCHEFPLVVMTSNGEREFPPAFLRRCLRIKMDHPADEAERTRKLERIVQAHLGPEAVGQVRKLIAEFASHTTREELATDQLLNAVYLTLKGAEPSREHLLNVIWKSLGGNGE